MLAAAARRATKNRPDTKNRPPAPASTDFHAPTAFES